MLEVHEREPLRQRYFEWHVFYEPRDLYVGCYWNGSETYDPRPGGILAWWRTRVYFVVFGLALKLTFWKQLGRRHPSRPVLEHLHERMGRPGMYKADP